MDGKDRIEQLCGLCGKPVCADHPGADVYHMSCMMERMRPMREKLQKERKGRDERL